MPNPLNPDVKTRMKMQLEQCRQALFQLQMSDQQFAHWGATYIRGLKVVLAMFPHLCDIFFTHTHD